MMFLDCPACLDEESAVRCGLPAEVRCWFTMCSADGPLESAMARCPVGHSFSGPIGSLTLRDGDDGIPEPIARRPNTAPAYYLGHRARLWITLMRPHRRPGAAARESGAPRPDLADVFFPGYYLAAGMP